MQDRETIVSRTSCGIEYLVPGLTFSEKYADSSEDFFTHLVRFCLEFRFLHLFGDKGELAGHCRQTDRLYPAKNLIHLVNFF